MKPSAMVVLALGLLCLSPAVHAQRGRRGRPARPVRSVVPATPPIEVIELAADRAYLSAGEDQGLHAGSTLLVGDDRFRVVAATRHHAVVALEGRALRPGDRVLPVASEPAREVAPVGQAGPPRPLRGYRGLWPRAVVPAKAQHPRPVPIGLVAPAGPVRAVLGQTTAAVIPVGAPDGSVVWGELRGRVQGELAGDVGFDVDAALRFWLLGGKSLQEGVAQPLVFARALELRWGSPRGAIATIGRLRQATGGVGMLDGVRVRSPSLGGLTLAAFGGAIPEPTTGAPSLASPRFGVELAYQALQAPLRPSIEVVAHGSAYRGRLDERRLDALVRLSPAGATVSLGMELSQFADGNPWGAAPIEVSAASLDTSVDLGAVRLGARLDVQRPERSLLLDDALPRGWLCEVVAGPPADPDHPACDDPELLLGSGTADLGVELGPLVLGAGASVGGRPDALEDLAAWALVRRAQILGGGRIELGAAATRTPWLDTLSVRPGLGISLFDGALDLSVHYRPVLVRGRLDDAAWLEHRAGLDLQAAASSRIDLTLSVETTNGGPEDLMILMTTATWRP